MGFLSCQKVVGARTSWLLQPATSFFQKRGNTDYTHDTNNNMPHKDVLLWVPKHSKTYSRPSNTRKEENGYMVEVLRHGLRIGEEGQLQ